MADICDKAQDIIERDLELRVRAAAADIPPGVPGECEVCDQHSPRLIRGACASCRDEFHLR